ncbi:MAG TPA: substrate-binding domain-containing protein, partial [Chitinophagaceae bacterium]|nr:substrate-binding domain-containing protein [Chitinophagaceae bacterium]
QFLQKEEKIDAMLFATNYLCITGLKAIAQIGAKIPEDIGVASFDDSELFELHSPSITAVAQPVEQIAEKAIGLLLNRLKGENKSESFKQITLPTSFVIRNSSKRIK